MYKSEYNVLSAFDGMSCGQIALIEEGIKIGKYYASETDKFAIKQTQHNFPNTIQLGCITTIKAKNLDRIDLFIGGSPCQGFSFAGKQLNFKDPRSKLFFEYVRILNEIREINPDVLFLLENVKMKKEYLRVISENLGMFPVRLNSNLVSAQNRDRFYWTNIKIKEVGFFGELWSNIPQPEDKEIILKDILQPESEVDEKYYIKNPKLVIRDNKERTDLSINPTKTHPLKPNEGRQRGTFIKLNKKNNPKTNQNKASCLTGGGHSGGNHPDMDIIQINPSNGDFVCVDANGKIDKNKTGAIISRYSKGVEKFGSSPFILKLNKKNNPKTNQNKAGCLTGGGHSGGNHPDMDIIQINPSKESNGTQPYQQNRVYSPDGKLPALNAELNGRNNILVQKSHGFNKGGEFIEKSPTILGNSWEHNNHITEGCGLRRLTPIECARLQTIPEWYEWIVSDSQIYKMLGNGWTVKMIKHIFSFIKN